MPIRQNLGTTLTSRERAELDWEKESAQMTKAYGERIAEMELEVRKLEVKWTQLFRFPLAILDLPIKLVLAFAIPIAAITKKELPKEYWRFLGVRE